MTFPQGLASLMPERLLSYQPLFGLVTALNDRDVPASKFHDGIVENSPHPSYSQNRACFDEWRIARYELPEWLEDLGNRGRIRKIAQNQR